MTMTNHLADCCRLLTHGVYVIAVNAGVKRNAFTAAWVMQASFDPLLLVFSINPDHYSYELLRQGETCSINVLAHDQLDLAAHFSQPGITCDKMSLGAWETGRSGAPLLLDALVAFDCRVSHYCAAGDHVLVVCQVIEARALRAGTPLLYSDTADLDGSRSLFPEKIDATITQ